MIYNVYRAIAKTYRNHTVIYFTADGTPSRYPTSREMAKKKRSSIYRHDDVCKKCMHIENGCRNRYTSSDKCVLCARLEALDYYNTNDIDPTDASIAAAKGLDYYIVPHPCKRSGHMGVLKVVDNTCAFCSEESKQRLDKSDRRGSARRKGKMWYMPSEPCTHCGELSPRRVNNDSCQTCEERSKGLSPTALMMKASPDMVISKQDAISIGWTVYRTGKPCRKGHRGFRYVASGNCLTCHRGR